MKNPGQSAPPGWYDDGHGQQRYWDGKRWTENVLPPEYLEHNALSADTGSAPPGWYDDGHEQQRYWDGKQWTERVEQGTISQPAQQPKTVKEYKRTCRACGTVWHSLASREIALNVSSFSNAGLSCCGSDKAAQAQHMHASNTLTTELERLKQCPSCGSSAYDQETVSH